MASSEMTQLEKSLKQTVDTFLQYSLRMTNKPILPSGRFKELVNNELPDFMKNLGDLDEKMRSLDVNNDNVLEFEEYLQLVCELIQGICREELGKKS